MSHSRRSAKLGTSNRPRPTRPARWPGWLIRTPKPWRGLRVIGRQRHTSPASPASLASLASTRWTIPAARRTRDEAIRMQGLDPTYDKVPDCDHSSPRVGTLRRPHTKCVAAFAGIAGIAGIAGMLDGSPRAGPMPLHGDPTVQILRHATVELFEADGVTAPSTNAGPTTRRRTGALPLAYTNWPSYRCSAQLTVGHLPHSCTLAPTHLRMASMW